MQRSEPDAFMARPTVWGLTVDGIKHYMVLRIVILLPKLFVLSVLLHLSE